MLADRALSRLLGADWPRSLEELDAASREILTRELEQTYFLPKITRIREVIEEYGVLRLEVLLEGEIIRDVVPHIGYLHRCFEKHAEKLPYNQVIPFVDRLDYVAAMNCEHVYAMGVERMLGITEQIPRRVEYIRVLMAELNRIASHFIAIGTYGMDIGAFTPFFWVMRDREHILRLLEWASGARLLYNYMWIGGLFYDLPVGFEKRCEEFLHYIKPKLEELETILINNKIFVDRTAGVGVLRAVRQPLLVAVVVGRLGAIERVLEVGQRVRRAEEVLARAAIEQGAAALPDALSATGPAIDHETAVVPAGGVTRVDHVVNTAPGSRSHPVSKSGSCSPVSPCAGSSDGASTSTGSSSDSSKSRVLRSTSCPGSTPAGTRQSADGGSASTST